MQKYWTDFVDEFASAGCEVDVYLASEADAKIAALEEDNRKLRIFAKFATGSSQYPVAKAAREVLAMVEETHHD